MADLRKIADATDVTAAAMADIREPDPSAVSFREEEETAMEDLRETDRAAAFREALDRVRKALRVIGVVRALAWAADAASAVASATAAELADREVVSEIIDREMASLRMLRQRIRKSGAMMRNGARAIRRGISAPARIISTRRMRRQGIAPADLSSLKRRKRKLSRR